MTHRFQPGDVVRLDFEWPHEKKKKDKEKKAAARSKAGNKYFADASEGRTGGTKERHAIVLYATGSLFYAVPITSNPPDAKDADYTHKLTGRMKAIPGLDGRDSYVKTHIGNIVDLPNSAVKCWAPEPSQATGFAPVRMPKELVRTLAKLNKAAADVNRDETIRIRSDMPEMTRNRTYSATRDATYSANRKTTETSTRAVPRAQKPARQDLRTDREEPRFLPGDPRGREAREARIAQAKANGAYTPPAPTRTTSARSAPVGRKTLTLSHPSKPSRSSDDDIR